ncbi:hypothetical protein L1987_65256 [Smallanthus sonchifolius]|uniref:Uncharacterized protein n=1 Tax=Smallanthus sonchifolius TaxID=185202 RepID=A0ACB9BU69_9ASTR|nr:hypothetical protein L1987_65256 [Smallanthus sonchifolius]
MQRYTGPFQIMTQRDEDILTVAFSPYLINTFHHLHRIILMKNDNLEVIFAIGSQDYREVATLQKNQQPSVFPYLEDLKLVEMVRMTHVWKCHWNKFLIPHKQEPISAFHNLRSIYMTDCHSINYLFSPLMAKLLVNLKEIKIERCKRIEQIVSDRDDKYDEMVTFLSTNTNATLFSHLDSVVLSNLICLKEIGGGKSSGVTLDQFQGPQATDDLWYLCQYSRKIDIYNCNLISSLIPFEAIHSMQKLESLRVTSLESMTELFETQRANNIRIDVCEGSNGDSVTTTTQWSTNVIEVQLPNLKTLHIRNCNRLRDVFNFSTLESLKRLEEFHVEYCDNIEVIVKEEGGDHVRSKDVSFRSLKSLKLVCLPNLNGFFLGQNNIEWPLLDTVVIKDWPKMTRFTHGHSTSPELKYIHAALGKYKVECGLNFDLTSAFQEVWFQYLCFTKLRNESPYITVWTMSSKQTHMHI